MPRWAAADEHAAGHAPRARREQPAGRGREQSAASGRGTRGASSARDHGGGGASSRGEPFSQLITYAGRSESFVIARDTFVPAGLVARWKPVFEGDRLIGTRAPNTEGNKSSNKWRAVSILRVERDAGPPVKPQDAWLDESASLLAQIEEERRQREGGGADALPADVEVGGTAAVGDVPTGSSDVDSDAICEALRLLDLAQAEIEQLEQAAAERADAAEELPEARMQRLLRQQRQPKPPPQEQPQEQQKQQQKQQQLQPKQRKPRHRHQQGPVLDVLRQSSDEGAAAAFLY